MPRFARLSVPALAAAAVLVLAGASGARTQHAYRTQTAALLAAINQARAAHGLHALRLDATLTRAARAHTLSMAQGDYFAHGAFTQRMLHFSVRGPFVGENLAWGSGSYGTPTGIVDAWLRSPEHRANLLRPGFRRIGLAETRTTFLGVAHAAVVTADFGGN